MNYTHAKTHWAEVAIGLSFILVLAAYIPYVNAGRNGNDFGRNVSAPWVRPTTIQGELHQEVTNINGCTKTPDGSCSFATPELRKKWEETTRPKGKKVTVTMYTSRAKETDDSPCISANGKDICKLLKEGVQTCASNDYKFGTKLHIEGLGECVVMDRMNRRYTGTGRIDWYKGMDLRGALNHGHPTLTITVLQ